MLTPFDQSGTRVLSPLMISRAVHAIVRVAVEKYRASVWPHAEAATLHAFEHHGGGDALGSSA